MKIYHFKQQSPKARVRVNLSRTRLNENAILENNKLCRYSGHISEICHPKMSTVSA